MLIRVSPEFRKKSKAAIFYFNQNQYLETHLQHLFFAVNSFHFYIGKLYFLMKKNLLQNMATLEENNI